MKKLFTLLSIAATCLLTRALAQTNYVSGRMNEVFRQTVLVPAATNLNDPWEITYGPDDSLWVTEAKGYQVRKVHPVNGGIRTILDLRDAASGGSFTPSSFRRQFAQAQSPWPQGGMMGLAIHPDYDNVTTPKKYIYIAYVRSYQGLNTTNPFNGESVSGNLFFTYLVRFTYDGSQLGSPVIMCDSIPGSNDHNSGRLIIKNIGSTPYLFYALGDMGAGQFANLSRTCKAQVLNSYEGKILRFNLEEDGDADQGAVDYNRWIPDDNPFNNVSPVTGQSAVWAVGIRNNQGFTTGTVNGFDRFYGASHGPFSDDEINLMESGKNYGHPLVIGYSADGNYNNAKPGPIGSSFSLIVSEAANAATIGISYMDPMFSSYAAPVGPGTAPWTPYYSVQTVYQNPAGVDTNPTAGGTQLAQNNNGMWWSEAYSGMGLYTNNLIPGWKNSLLLASLKWGRVVRMNLNADGSDILNGGAGGMDTVSYYGGINRFRDVAVAPNGKDIYVVMDRSTSSSGPSASNPIVPACAGCVQKYEFLGYNPTAVSPFPSTIPTTIPIEAGTLNSCASGNTVTINAVNNNNNLWVPITGPDGNIIAEIDANGNDLGTVTSSFYVRSGSPVRSASANNKYLNRNITISVQNQPSTAVNVRLYITATELADMISTTGSGVAGITDLGIYKNNDACGSTLSAVPAGQTITGRYTHGSFGHAIQASINSFSTFYFLSTTSTLPVNVISFTGKAQNDAALLKWDVGNQDKTENYIVERSLNNTDFDAIGDVAAKGTGSVSYNFTDFNAGKLAATVYYRIKIADQDGSFKYTNTINVAFAAINEPFVSAYPNPVKEKTVILVNSTTDETVQLRIVDNTGRTVSQRTITLSKGRNNFEVNMIHLPAGLYYIDVTGKTINQKIKLIKQ